MMDFLFAVSIAALFSGLHVRIESIKIQLADVLAVLAAFVAILRGIASPRLSATVVLVLAIYLLWYCVSAFSVGMATGVKELLQVVLVGGFQFALFGYYRTRATDRLLIMSSFLILVILMVNISWHIQNGTGAGWKSLNEPKTIFSIAPLVMILLYERFHQTWKYPLLFTAGGFVLAIVIALSGERKAYIVGAIALIAWVPIRKIWRYVLVALMALLLVIPMLSNERAAYLGRQITSVISGFGASSDAISLSRLLDASDAAPGTTLSTLQRSFSTQYARTLWEASPIIGIGTGAFDVAIKGDARIPKQYQMNIHGEFYRALYENGVIGFALYALIWLSSLGIATIRLRQASRQDLKSRKLQLLTIVTMSIYCSFEASKELTQLCICILPAIVAYSSATAFLHVKSDGFRHLAPSNHSHH